MEPTERGVMKFVNEFEGFTRMSQCQPFGADRKQTLSVPRSHAQNPTDTIPTVGRAAIHGVIDKFLPRLSGRELFDTAIC